MSILPTSLGSSLCCLMLLAIFGLGWYTVSLQGRRCPHHWHAVSYWAWKCCICCKTLDEGDEGMPTDGTTACAFKGQTS